MRKKSGHNPVAIVVLLLIIAIAIGSLIKRTRGPAPSPGPMVDWTCEVCGYRLVAESHGEPMICPYRESRDELACGGEAVRTHYYYCSVHDHVFEAFRTKTNPDPEPGIPAEMVIYKVPGGEWGTEMPARIICPKGNSDSSTMKRAPPGSEYRRAEAAIMSPGPPE